MVTHLLQPSQFFRRNGFAEVTRNARPIPIIRPAVPPSSAIGKFTATLCQLIGTQLTNPPASPRWCAWRCQRASSHGRWWFPIIEYPCGIVSATNNDVHPRNCQRFHANFKTGPLLLFFDPWTKIRRNNVRVLLFVESDTDVPECLRSEETFGN